MHVRTAAVRGDGAPTPVLLGGRRAAVIRAWLLALCVGGHRSPRLRQLTVTLMSLPVE